jgi:uncharacterized protein (TIGR00299 family) protein
MKSILFDMQSGVAGDMVCAAALDLGIDVTEFISRIKTLPIKFDITVQKVKRSGLSANYFSVAYPHQHYHRHLKDILEIISKSDLSLKAKERAELIFNRLGAAEAKVHGTTIEHVHFHEVGAVDSIVDIAGAALLFEMAGVERFFTTPFVHGHGTVKTEHGVLGVPAPATLELTRGFESVRLDIQGELTTPTGAAIISSLVDPSIILGGHKVVAIGYGAGTKELPGMPNVLRLAVVETEDNSNEESVTLIQTNIDDSTPELIGRALEKLLEEGALDVFSTPISMKKNRPAMMLTVIVKDSDKKRMADILMEETGSIGVRFSHWDRYCLDRKKSEVVTEWGVVQVKVIEMPSGTRITPEYDSCRELSKKSGVSVRRIYEAVMKLGGIKK